MDPTQTKPWYLSTGMVAPILLMVFAALGVKVDGDLYTMLTNNIDSIVTLGLALVAARGRLNATQHIGGGITGSAVQAPVGPTPSDYYPPAMPAAPVSDVCVHCGQPYNHAPTQAYNPYGGQPVG